MLYLDIPSTQDYAELAAWRGDLGVSLFLPTTPVTRETMVPLAMSALGPNSARAFASLTGLACQIAAFCLRAW